MQEGVDAPLQQEGGENPHEVQTDGEVECHPRVRSAGCAHLFTSSLLVADEARFREDQRYKKRAGAIVLPALDPMPRTL